MASLDCFNYQLFGAFELLSGIDRPHFCFRPTTAAAAAAADAPNEPSVTTCTFFIPVLILQAKIVGIDISHKDIQLS